MLIISIVQLVQTIYCKTSNLSSPIEELLLMCIVFFVLSVHNITRRENQTRCSLGIALIMLLENYWLLIDKALVKFPEAS